MFNTVRLPQRCFAFQDLLAETAQLKGLLEAKDSELTRVSQQNKGLVTQLREEEIQRRDAQGHLTATQRRCTDLESQVTELTAEVRQLKQEGGPVVGRLVEQVKVMMDKVREKEDQRYGEGLGVCSLLPPPPCPQGRIRTADKRRRRRGGFPPPPGPRFHGEKT